MEEINPPKNSEDSNSLVKKKGTKKNKLLYIFAALLILSLAANVFLFLTLNKIKISGNSVSEDSFRFITPIDKELVNSDTLVTDNILHYENLKPIILKEIEVYGEGDVGVYLQDIKKGAWLGINEKEGFSPASLLKVPLMMSLLKKVELGEISLNDTITITPEDLDSGYGTLYKKGAGTKMTISELLDEMILYSDNTARNAIQNKLSYMEINSVFLHVGIPDPYLTSNTPTVSPRDYTRFFKSLYFSTFLSPKLSEMAIELTSNTQEENLLSAKIPAKIKVAHKFGVFYEDSDKIVHDCGIVYHPKNPYFLCIMTKNLEMEKGKEVIQTISKDIYDYIDKK